MGLPAIAGSRRPSRPSTIDGFPTSSRFSYPGFFENSWARLVAARRGRGAVSRDSIGVKRPNRFTSSDSWAAGKTDLWRRYRLAERPPRLGEGGRCPTRSIEQARAVRPSRPTSFSAAQAKDNLSSGRNA